MTKIGTVLILGAIGITAMALVTCGSLDREAEMLRKENERLRAENTSLKIKAEAASENVVKLKELELEIEKEHTEQIASESSVKREDAQTKQAELELERKELESKHPRYYKACRLANNKEFTRAAKDVVASAAAVAITAPIDVEVKDKKSPWHIRLGFKKKEDK